MRHFVVVAALVMGVPAHAEDVDPRAKAAASSAKRLRGASGVRMIPGGVLSLGGSKLRHMADGAKGWRVIHEVPGDNLYRVDADARGRVLAVWEREAVFHLFDLRSGTHQRLTKPPMPPGYKPDATARVEGVHFTDDGRHVIVYVAGLVWEYHTGSRGVLAGYRMALSGKGAPELLFQDEGMDIHKTVRGMTVVRPSSWTHGCGHYGCPVKEIVAYQLTEGPVKARTIFVPPQGLRVDSARIVGGNQEHFAAEIGGWDGKRRRHMLRYTYGREPVLQPLSDPTSARDGLALLARNGDFIEVRQGEDRSVTVMRLDAAGKESTAVIRPWADKRGRAVRDFVVAMGERADGSLWMHWGDSLVVGAPAAPRRHDVGGHVKRGTEWAGAYIYEEKPERLWMGIEVGGGRDYVVVDLADVDRLARPWLPPTVGADTPEPMPPSTARRLTGTRRETALPRGVLSVGQRDVYFRDDPKADWRLLYAVPGRNLYRIAVDERRGRILAHWSSEKQLHLFEPGQGVHRTFAWPAPEVEGLQSGLLDLFFDPDERFALVYMGGLVRGSGPHMTEAYRVPLDGKSVPRRLFVAQGNYLDLSARGAAFVLPTQQSGYRCDTVTCIADLVATVTLDGERATEEVVFRRGTGYVDFARRVPGRAGDELAVVIRASKGRGNERVLLRFRYGAPGLAETTVLPDWTTEAVRRSHLTDAGDYLEFVVLEEKQLVIELFGKAGARATWRVPSPREAVGDHRPDRAVHGFGERAGGGWWLHWGDHILLLRGQEARSFSLARYLSGGGEWAGADGYTASPESLRIGIDQGAGRRFVDVGFTTIEKGAVRLR